MNSFVKVVVASAVVLMPVCAQAQSGGNLLGSPVVAAGNIVSGVAGIHHQALGPSASGIVPTITPTADGVTNALGSVGTGLTNTGKRIQTDGVVVGGSGTGGAPLVSVRSSNPATQGTVAAVANGQ